MCSTSVAYISCCLSLWNYVCDWLPTVRLQTIDFSVLTDGDKAEFKKHDKINPPLRLSHVALGKETSSTPLLPVGNPSIADAIGTGAV